MAHEVKTWLGTPSSFNRDGSSPALLLLIQLPANVPGRQNNGQYTWVPVTYLEKAVGVSGS